jgi:type VI secretion system protein ImpG
VDPRLLKYYSRELQHINEMGTEFAREFPKIAGRLGMETLPVADPYVERLLEGFAFLAARVQLKIDSEFPRFTQHLLDLVYPHYLAPLPAMAVVQLAPLLEEGALAEGVTLPRQTSLRGALAGGERTACEFRTCQDVTLWPIEVTDAAYFGSAGALATIGVNRLDGVRAGIRVRLRATAGVAFDQLPLDRLVFYLKSTGTTQIVARLFEQLLGNATAFLVRPKGGAQSWQDYHEPRQIEPVGFDRDEALLPPLLRTFEGYRYLQEYFAFPARFAFVALTGLARSVRRCTSTELELIVLLNRRDAELENVVDKEHFTLNCTPAVNLFPKKMDRIHLNTRNHEYHVVPDRTRPMDFEVWSVAEVQGFGSGAQPEKTFLPFYAAHDHSATSEAAYFSVYREPRRLSSRQRERGTKSAYVGSETYVSIVDPNNAPYLSSLRQLGVQGLCTNRDLPLHMPLGRGSTDFTLDSGAPVETIRCVAGPTKPRPSVAHGDPTWQLISHLYLNYLSLVEDGAGGGAAAIRSLLALYADQSDAAVQRQIEGLKTVQSRRVTGRIPSDGPIAYGRGVEVALTCDESAFEGTGAFLLGLVLQEFFTKYVSVNSFTETVLASTERGEIMRWRSALGRRPTL